jgi:protein-L-isoaspartate O-methyltransferase
MSNISYLSHINAVRNQIYPRFQPKADDPLIPHFLHVSRLAFLPALLQPFAYIDTAQHISDGRRLLPIGVLYQLLSLAKLKSDDRVLHIEDDEAYVSTLAALHVNKVICTYRPSVLNSDLVVEATRQLNVHNMLFYESKSVDFVPEAEPYSLIMCLHPLMHIPLTWADHLRPNGRIIAIVISEQMTLTNSNANILTNIVYATNERGSLAIQHHYPLWLPASFLIDHNR